MEYQKHFFSGGTPRTITIALPSDDLTVKYPAVILCHGHSHHKNDGLDALLFRSVQTVIFVTVWTLCPKF